MNVDNQNQNWMDETLVKLKKEFRERMAIKEQSLKIGDKVMADDHIKAKFHGEVGTIVEPQDGDRTEFDDGRKVFWVKFDKPNMGTWALTACDISKI